MNYFIPQSRIQNRKSRGMVTHFLEREPRAFMPNEAPQPLLEPHWLGDLLLPNRIVMAPLTRGRARNPGHVPNDLMREYYEQRSTAGLIITEGTWVSEDGQGWVGAPGIYNREQGDAWAKITDAVHSSGGRIFAQLWHQGAVSHASFFFDARLPIAPSAIDPKQTVYVAGGTVMTETPREMTRADIKQAVADFHNAAQIAMDAGFDGRVSALSYSSIRMLEALETEVLRLVRVAIGTLTLGDLPKGATRALKFEEKQALDRAMGAQNREPASLVR